MLNDSTDNITIKVGIVDDHVFVTNAFATRLNNMLGIHAVLEAYDGEHLLQQLKNMQELPDILLMDVEMKPMNGITATREVRTLYPGIKTIAFSSKNDDWSIVQMIGAGACAYLSKTVSPEQMEQAIHEVYHKSKYHADLYHLYSAELREYSKGISDLSFNENETLFLKLLCKGYRHNQMAKEMQITRKGIEYISKCISEKLNTNSKVIIAIEALRMGIVTLDEDNQRQHKIVS